MFATKVFSNLLIFPQQRTEINKSNKTKHEK